MDAAIRRYGKTGGDVEAAEKLAKHLEAMGYDLNCNSFITKGSSQKTGQLVERYAAKSSNEGGRYGKYPSRYNFDGVDSDEESSSSDEVEDDDDDSSDDSDDEEDSSDDDSVEQNKYSKFSREEKKRKAEKAKKEEFVQRIVEKSANNTSPTWAETREPAAETNRTQLKYVDDRDGPVLRIAPNRKENEETYKQAIAIGGRKRSGIGRMFQHAIKAKGSTHSEGSQAKYAELKSHSGKSRSRDSLEESDAIQRQRSGGTQTSCNSKRSSGSSRSRGSAKSPCSKVSETSKKTDTSKLSAVSKKTDTTKRSKSSSKSAGTKKSEISALTSVASEGLTKASSKTLKAGAKASSPGRTWQEKRSTQTLHEAESEQYLDSVNEIEEERDEIAASRSSKVDIYINQSESSEDGPKEFPTIAAIGTIEATATMMNEGALEIPLKSKSQSSLNVETVRTGLSESDESKPHLRTEFDTLIHGMKDIDDDVKRYDIPAVATGQTETSQSAAQDSDVSAEPVPEQLGAPPSEEEIIRPLAHGSKRETRAKPRRGFFRRMKPQLTVNPNATVSSQHRPKSTERAIVDQASSLLKHPMTPAENEVPEPVEEVLIEGMSVVKQNELIEDQMFDGDGLDDALHVPDPPLTNQPLLISARPQASPHRRLNRHSSPHRRRNHSPSKRKSPSRSHHKRNSSTKSKPVKQRSLSKSQQCLSEEPKLSAPGPSVNFAFPVEEREYEPEPRENENTNGKKKVKIGKFLGKMFLRREKKEKAQIETPEPVEDLSVYEDETGLEFRVRSPARSFEERITEQVLDTEKVGPGEEEKKALKSVVFADSVKVSASRNSDGDGIETKIPSDGSISLRSDIRLGDFLEVEVDNEENHAGEEEEEARKQRYSAKSRVRKVVTLDVPGGSSVEASDSAQSVDTGAAVSKVTDMVTAFGDFMRSLTVSAEPDPDVKPIQIKSPLPKRKVRSAAATFGDSSTVDTNVLQSEYPSKCGANQEEEPSHKKQPKKPMRAVSTLEGIRLAAMSPTRQIRYTPEPDIISAPSQGSIDVWPSPMARKKPMILKSALKNSTPKTKPNIGTTPTSVSRRVRSMPHNVVGAKSLAVNTASPHISGNEKDFFPKSPKSPVARRMPSLRKTQKYEARHVPVSPSANLSVLSPNSTAAIADPLSPSSYDEGEGSIVSSLRVPTMPSNLGTMPSNLGTTTSMGPYEEQQVAEDEATRWAEVNNAANILGRVMGPVENNQSVDTSDEAQRLRVLLSEDSTMGDVEQALDVLKRHAHRLGIRETELLLAAVKSEDTEMMSIRSWTLGEELMDMVNSFFKRKNR